MASGPDALWDLLVSGQDGIQGSYDDVRLDIASARDEEWVRRLRALQCGTLDDIDRFDAPAFNISAREARLLDPQQRLLLEASSEALDDAGIDARRLVGGNVGVYAAVYGSDYQRRLFRHFPDVDIALTTGAGAYALPGRVSYAFGWQGPCYTIETASSASLVAIHAACRALGAGECDLALASGVNLLLDPLITLAYLNAGALSPRGRCRFADAGASGYVRSEGVAAIVLKPLARALADGDRIYATIRGSAVAHVGQTGDSLFSPGERAQVDLFERTLALAGLTPSELDYIEAHGTGTRLGDRAELGAIGAMLRADRAPRARPCLVGSVKSNIGHAEAAAGIAGVIKTALALRHGAVPGNLHFDTPNPEIAWDDALFRVPTATTPLGDGARPAIAMVNSFGITGTIACVALEAPPAPAPAPAAPPAAAPSAAPILLPLSARTPEALRRHAGSLRDRLRAADAGLADIAHSAALRRTHHEVRLAAVGRTAGDLVEALAGFVEGEPAPNVRVADEAAVVAPTIGWVFCGQGPQWAGMGMGLYAAEPVFRATIDRFDALIRAEAGISIIDEICAEGDASRLDLTEITQPTLFAVQVATAAQLAAWGLAPAMIVGHSVGEVAAAHVAGVLSAEDAARVICARGRVAEKATGLGKMAAFEASVAEAEAIVAASGGGVSVAVVNGPRSVTLSGPRAPLQAACDRAAAEGRFARMVDVDYPSHCALLEPLIPEMAAATAGVTMRPPAIALYSTVLGRAHDAATLTPGYWARNLREPVLFAAAAEAMARAGCDLFVEISPHPAVAFSLKQVLAHGGHAAGVIGTLRRGEDEAAGLRVAAAEHYVRGAELDWAALAPAGGAFVPLPRHPWDHERYWIEEPATGAPRAADRAPAGAHPLLQRRLDLLGGAGTCWQSDISLARCPWLGERRVRGGAALPAAGVVAAMLAAADALTPGSSLADVALHAPPPLADDGALRLQVAASADPGAPGGYRLTVDAAPADRPAGARGCATARIAPAPDAFAARLTPWRADGETIDRAAFYAALARGGLDHRGAFRAVETLAVDGARAAATLRPADGAAAGADIAAIDACVQVLLALAPGWRAGGEPWRAAAIERVRARPGFAAAGARAVLATGVPSLLGDDFAGDVALVDEAGEVLLSLEGVRLRPAPAAADTPPDAPAVAAAAPAGPEPAAARASPAAGGLRDELAAAAPGAARRGVLEKHVVGRLSRVLRTPAKALGVRKSFKSLGLDSLTALELRTALEADTGLTLPASVIFNHANVTKLATELAARMSVALDPDPACAPPSPAGGQDDVAALLEALRALPEDEAMRLLSSEGAL